MVTAPTTKRPCSPRRRRSRPCVGRHALPTQPGASDSHTSTSQHGSTNANTAWRHNLPADATTHATVSKTARCPAFTHRATTHGHPLVGVHLEQGEQGVPETGTYGAQPGPNKSGQYQAWHRFYNPTTGRWTTPDPAAAPWTNLVGYVGGNPASGSDPTGLDQLRRGDTRGTTRWHPADEGAMRFRSPFGQGAPRAEDFTEVDASDWRLRGYAAFIFSDWAVVGSISYTRLWEEDPECPCGWRVRAVCRDDRRYLPHINVERSFVARGGFEGEVGGRLLEHERTHYYIFWKHIMFYNKYLNEHLQEQISDASMCSDALVNPPGTRTHTPREVAASRRKSLERDCRHKLEAFKRSLPITMVNIIAQNKMDQDRYEAETNHGRNREAQERWNREVGDAIGDLGIPFHPFDWAYPRGH